MIGPCPDAVQGPFSLNLLIFYPLDRSEKCANSLSCAGSVARLIAKAGFEMRRDLMSEPLSSTEIEDVLSSIRRLVSDDIRPAGRVGSGSATTGKLILTPALRVVQTDSDASMSVKPEPAPELAKVTVVTPLPMFVATLRTNLLDDAPIGGIGSVVATVSAAVDAAPDDWEAEIGEAAPQHASSLVSAWSTVEEGEDMLHPDAEADTAKPDHFEYHATEDVTPAPWDQQEVAQPEDEAASAEASQESPPTAESDVALHGTLEPDQVWADAAEASVIAALAEPDLAKTFDAAEDDDFDKGMRFDEDVLRELVRDMLREELAGKMGERITRNIRKLVRAEIARALASQELE